ncbi:MAG: hypothetical protein JJU29_15985 [Verrucomicrobia bacterium]|nr:hypothetical protein [Verrucomicrobiota bacterium]MCH8514055.1 hypothetical protein [Kiritimatiellia bacterium]
MIEEKPIFSPAYKGALVLVVTQQVLLWLLTGVVLTGGFLESIVWYALIAFWVGFVLYGVKPPDVMVRHQIAADEVSKFCAMIENLYRDRLKNDAEVLECINIRSGPCQTKWEGAGRACSGDPFLARALGTLSRRNG